MRSFLLLPDSPFLRRLFISFIYFVAVLGPVATFSAAYAALTLPDGSARTLAIYWFFTDLSSAGSAVGVLYARRHRPSWIRCLLWALVVAFALSSAPFVIALTSAPFFFVLMVGALLLVRAALAHAWLAPNQPLHPTQDNS